MELKYIVYITINLCNGKFYIGVHKTNPEVFDGYLGSGNIIEKAIKKYGKENFKRTTLKIFPNTKQGADDAFKLEGELVNETLLKSKNCYNVALGGLGDRGLNDTKQVYMFSLDGKYIRSFKTCREAARSLQTDNEVSTLKAIRNNCLGATTSSFGYYWSYNKEFNYKDNRITKVAQYTIGGKFLRYFDSIAEAENTFKISNISSAIQTKGSSGGYQWRYYTGDNSDIGTLNNVRTRNNSLSINMYDKENNLIESFESVNSCIKKYPELISSQINRVLKGIIKSHKGYKFKYQDENIV